MFGEIIAIGDELISGRVLNTTSTFAARQLTLAGFYIKRITVIGDSLADIKECLLDSLNRSKFIIVTGGLGATTDDITNEAVAKAFGLELEVRKDLLKKINECGPCDVASKKYAEKMAIVPKGAEILDINSHAAGYLLTYQGKFFFFLPGIPTQLEAQLEKQVIPRLKKIFSTENVVHYKLYKIFGLGETEINQKLEGLEKRFPHIQIGYYPNFPEIHLTITARQRPEDKNLVHDFNVVCEEIKKILGTNIVAEDQDSLESVLGSLLTDRQANLAVAESCTGGMVGERITSVSGSSKWFECGVVTYSNKAKTTILGVPDKIIKEHGAVSRETATKMVEGIMKLGNVPYGLSITGIAGPTGGTPEKPVGTVFIGMGTPDKIFVEHFIFSGNRNEIRTLASETALDWLRRYLKYGTTVPGYRPA